MKFLTLLKFNIVSWYSDVLKGNNLARIIYFNETMNTSYNSYSQAWFSEGVSLLASIFELGSFVEIVFDWQTERFGAP